MITAIFVVALAIIASCENPNEDPLWREFKLKFGKFYPKKHEESGRYFIWKQHLKEILEHNNNADNKFKKGINQYSDLVSKFQLAINYSWLKRFARFFNAMYIMYICYE